MYTRRLLALGFTALLVLPLTACPMTGPEWRESPPVKQQGDIISGTGTVEYFDLEGGFFAIRGDDRKVYDPINLPDSFRERNLRVRFTARLRNDMGSVHMVGPMVEILEIERLR